jgi:uncharacterized membrane-anchored protein YitT (DUF2179 family)
MPLPDPAAIAHSPLEDAQGLGAGVIMCTLGLLFLTHLGLLTGQTAGLALLIAYVTGWSFGAVFLVVSVPFYVLAWRRMGAEFTLKSAGCVVAVAAGSEFLPRLVVLGEVQPAVGAVLFGVMTAFGLLAIFRHKGSLGGLGVVALMVQDSTGFRAGWVQLIFDLCLFAVALVLFPVGVVAYSLLGAAVLNVMIALNHRRDRYIAG